MADPADELGPEHPTTCQNCDHPIRRLDGSSTGWTHGRRPRAADWQGIRCPRRLTGAQPRPSPADMPEPVTVAGLNPHPARSANGYPIVRGRCPACRMESLFLAVGSYVTCASLACTNPTAVSDLLKVDGA